MDEAQILSPFHQNLPNIECCGRFATFRLKAFSCSKTLFRFGGWFSWEPVANTNRWALEIKDSNSHYGTVRSLLMPGKTVLVTE
jgi:hypothetical protein